MDLNGWPCLYCIQQLQTDYLPSYSEPVATNKLGEYFALFAALSVNMEEAGASLGHIPPHSPLPAAFSSSPPLCVCVGVACVFRTGVKWVVECQQCASVCVLQRG